MTKSPVSIHKERLAVEALRIMEIGTKNLSVLPVLDDENKVCGLISNHNIIKLGIFL